MKEIRVNKTNEQQSRSQFAKAEGALRLLRWMEMPAAPSGQHAITHQRPSYQGLDRFGPQGWLLHLNLRLRCYALPHLDVLLDKGDELFR